MKPKINQKLTILFIFTAFILSSLAFGDTLKINNETEYYIWVKDIESESYPTRLSIFLPVRTVLNSPLFQPVAPKKNVTGVFEGYTIGTPRQNEIHYYISKTNDANDALSRHLMGRLKIDKASTINWSPFGANDKKISIEQSSAVNKVFTVTIKTQ